MMMTSGSTAMPKLVVHNLNAHLKSALGGQKVLDIRRGDRYLLSLPLNHVGGQAVIFKCVLTGAVMVSPRKDMSPAGQILQDRITVLSLVPTQLVRIMENHPEVLAESCVRAILLGGAPIDDMLIARMHDLYPSIALYGSYGSTEMASQICTNVLLKGKEITAGFPLPYRELILNSDGEILVRGETLCMGYFRNGLIEKVTGDDGYFHTGDIGRMLPSGLTVSGRRDNMFISGGENIHPEQVEAMLLKNQNIAEVLVVPVRDHEWGMMAVALVRTAPGFNGTLEDLRQQALSEMSHVYVPKIWLNMPEIENTGLKIRRGKYIEFAEKALNSR
jgi:O-succinylbenzoic acid--CoA ligase